jgi:hypothetical protein
MFLSLTKTNHMPKKKFGKDEILNEFLTLLATIFDSHVKM